MADPPRDAEGNVVPHDDVDIHNDHAVLRYVPPSQWVWDANESRFVVSSGAFSESSDGTGMSIDLENHMVAAGIANDAQLPDPTFGIARIGVGPLRGFALQVGSDPLGDNPYHGCVWGIKTATRRKIKAVAVMLRDPKKE